MIRYVSVEIRIEKTKGEQKKTMEEISRMRLYLETDLDAVEASSLDSYPLYF